MIPSRKAVRIGCNAGHPHVAARVFEEPIDLPRRQTVLRRVHRKRSRRPERVEAIGSRKTVETLPRAYPPFAAARLQREPLADPPPTEGFDAGWLESGEAASIEATDSLIVSGLVGADEVESSAFEHAGSRVSQNQASETQIARAIVEDAAHLSRSRLVRRRRSVH